MGTPKLKLFNQGASALKNILGLDTIYVCPICTRKFELNALENELLTLEHVPPASAGGRGILLTCKECNNQSGHKYESHISKKNKVAKFAQTLIGKKEGFGGRGRLSFNGIAVNVDVSTADGKTRISILGDRNDPQLVNKLQESMKSAATESPQSMIRFDLNSSERYEFKKYQLSLLKSAYLVAVAKLGYLYALSPALEVVRSQIKNPEQPIFDNWHLKLSEMKSNFLGFDQEKLVILVVISGESVLLPWHLNDIENYLEITTKLSHGILVNFSFAPITWPTSFEAILDRAP